MFKVPVPKFCPECRQKVRLSFANYSNIYKRKCDVSGHDDTMISPVAPVMPWITYDYESISKKKEMDKRIFAMLLDRFLSIEI